MAPTDSDQAHRRLFALARRLNGLPVEIVNNRFLHRETDHGSYLYLRAWHRALEFIGPRKSNWRSSPTL